MMTSPTASLGSKPFRFGVVTPITTDLPAWKDRVRRIAGLGYSTLLMPDVPRFHPAPGPTLATAACLAPELRVGTWVYAAGVRPPWVAAWEAHSLSVLTEGKFELGLGGGRPGIEDELRTLHVPVAGPGERLAQIRQTVAALRELEAAGDSCSRAPVVMAVAGPKARALAAEIADTVTFALPPSASREQITRVVRGFRAIYADRDLELSQHVAVVGDGIAPFMASAADTDLAALHAEDSLVVLPDDPSAAAEEIQRRREELGFSYFVFGADVAETLAPVAVHREERGAVPLHQLAHHRETALLLAGLRAFDLDDVGAEVAQQLGGIGTKHHLSEVEHPDAVERTGHITLLSLLTSEAGRPNARRVTARRGSSRYASRSQEPVHDSR